MSPIARNVFAGLLYFLSTKMLLAQTVVFEDRSAFENFFVVMVDADGRELTAIETDRGQEVDLSSFPPGELVTLGVRFLVPEEEGSVSFFIQDAKIMQIDILLEVPEGGAARELMIPVYYFESIGRQGFKQIERRAQNILENSFEKFFKAAQMAQHYRLRLGTTNSELFRTSLKLWRDANIELSEALPDWWRMHVEIVYSSESSFGRDSVFHQETISLFEEINRSRK